MKTSATLLLVVLVVAIVNTEVWADTVLSIRDVQYPTAADGASLQNGNIIDCLGGYVIHKTGGSYPRVYLYDPDYYDGWGGISVKASEGDPITNVDVGEWISLKSLLVTENRDTTFLQYGSSSSFTIDTGRGLLTSPPSIVVAAADIAAPCLVDDVCEVANHLAEKYESMLLTVSNLTVTAMDLGKAYDNYNLRDSSGDLWAADYINADKGEAYLPAIGVNENFASVTGILEQYKGFKNDVDWDYYQLLTRTADDVVAVPEPAAISMLLFMAGLLVFAKAVAWWCGPVPVNPGSPLGALDSLLMRPSVTVLRWNRLRRAVNLRLFARRL